MPAHQFRSQLGLILPRLRRFGHALTGSEEEGDDLVQDALVKALKNESQFTPGTRLDSWIFRIMQTTWIDKMRSAKVRAAHVPDLEATYTAAGVDGRRDFPARIALQQTRDAMSRLPDDCRIALALTSIEGYSYKEVAETLNVPIGTIMSRVSRARRLLLENFSTKEVRTGHAT